MAVQISRKYKCIFVHVPKTGGFSIENSLLFDDQRIATREAVGGHMTALKFRENYPEEFADFFKFAFVRNPFDRVVSAFHYFAQYRGGQEENLEMKKLIAEKCEGNFVAFCKKLLSDDRIKSDVHLRPQVDFVTDEQGNVIVDFVGRFENIKHDFEEICKNIGVAIDLKHLNRTVRRDYSTYYTPVAKDIVAEVYAKDFQLVGYGFEYSRARVLHQDLIALYVLLRKVGGRLMRKSLLQNLKNLKW